MRQFNDEFVDYIIDMIGNIGNQYLITTRKMFGGHGVYSNGKICAIIVDQEFYLKGSSPQAQKFFSQSGAEQFSYERNGKIVKMSYWKIPVEILDNPDFFQEWLQIAVNE